MGSRQEEAQEELVPEAVVNEAAVKIQAAFRGYKVWTSCMVLCLRLFVLRPANLLGTSAQRFTFVYTAKLVAKMCPIISESLDVVGWDIQQTVSTSQSLEQIQIQWKKSNFRCVDYFEHIPPCACRYYRQS